VDKAAGGGAQTACIRNDGRAYVEKHEGDGQGLETKSSDIW